MRKMMVFLVCVTLMAGCMYPQEKLQKNTVPYKEQIQAVQIAVDEFKQANNGLLPIETRDAGTPIYQKYPIDFSKLIPKFMNEPPGNSFDNGGIYQYVLVDVESKPTVKLLDLRVSDKIREVKLKIQMYRDTYHYPPYLQVIDDGVYSLDFIKLGYKEEPYIQSPYSGKNLPFVIDGKGEVYVDYRIDLQDALQKYKGESKQGQDLRNLLLRDSPFVPAYSLPYMLKDNEPKFFIQ